LPQARLIIAIDSPEEALGYLAQRERIGDVEMLASPQVASFMNLLWPGLRFHAFDQESFFAQASELSESAMEALLIRQLGALAKRDWDEVIVLGAGPLALILTRYLSAQRWPGVRLNPISGDHEFGSLAAALASATPAEEGPLHLSELLQLWAGAPNLPLRPPETELSARLRALKGTRELVLVDLCNLVRDNIPEQLFLIDLYVALAGSAQFCPLLLVDEGRDHSFLVSRLREKIGDEFHFISAREESLAQLVGAVDVVLSDAPLTLTLAALFERWSVAVLPDTARAFWLRSSVEGSWVVTAPPQERPSLAGLLGLLAGAESEKFKELEAYQCKSGELVAPGSYSASYAAWWCQRALVHKLLGRPAPPAPRKGQLIANYLRAERQASKETFLVLLDEYKRTQRWDHLWASRALQERPLLALALAPLRLELTEAIPSKDWPKHLKQSLAEFFDFLDQLEAAN